MTTPILSPATHTAKATLPALAKEEVASEVVKEEETEEVALTEEVRPRKHLPPLLVSLNDRKCERLHVSAGAWAEG